MSIKGKAYLVGAYEHPARQCPDKSVAQLHAEVAQGALEDAGLAKQDVDGYFCAGDAPGLGPLSMADYLGLKLRHMESTDTGGSSYLIHVSHAAQAIAAGKCDVALVTPLRDGMNLVAKEYIASRTDKTGVLILSEMAGSAKELNDAIIINPNHREEIAQALEQALAMPRHEQIERNRLMQTTLRRHTVGRWATAFLGDIFAMEPSLEGSYAKPLDPVSQEIGRAHV